MTTQKSRGNFIYCARFEYFESHNTIQRERRGTTAERLRLSRTIWSWRQNASSGTVWSEKDWVQPRAPPPPPPTSKRNAHHTGKVAPQPTTRSIATGKCSTTVTTVVNLRPGLVPGRTLATHSETSDDERSEEERVSANRTNHASIANIASQSPPLRSSPYVNKPS